MGDNVTGIAAEGVGDHGEPLGVAFAFLMLSLMLGTFVKTLLELLPRSAYHPPYSVMIFGLGMLCGQIDHSVNDNGEASGTMHESISYWAVVDPHVIMFGLLPPLLFESALGMDFHVFAKVFYVASIMALPGVLLCTVLTGCVAMLFFGHCCNISWWGCVLLGSILSATDPVAVVAVLKTLGAPAHLQHMIEGESLLNDGSAVVVFLVAQQMLDVDTALTVPEIIGKFFRLAGGGVLWGLCAGYVAFFWCKLSRHASVIDIAVLVLCVYMVFYVGEWHLHVSGVLASVTFGVLFCRLAPHAMSEHVQHHNHVVFEQICHFAETHIFMLAGLIIHRRFFISMSDLDMAYHIPMSLVLYLVLHVIRASVIGMFTPILGRLGYGLTLGESVIMTYGGLRGAVSLAMALMLDLDPTVDEVFRDLVVFHTAMIVALTIVINGTTAGALYGWLDMYPTNQFRKELRDRGFDLLAHEVNTIFDELQHDWFHKPAHIPTLRKVCPDFANADMKYGHVRFKPPTMNVHKIFFDKEGYIHRNLHHWNRAKVGLRAFQLTMQMAGGNLPSGLSSHALASGGTHHEGRQVHFSSDRSPPDLASGGAHNDMQQPTPAHLERSTSAPAIVPTDDAEVHVEAQQTAVGFSSRTQSNHVDELCPHLWVGRLPQYQANEPCLRDMFERFGTVELVAARNKPDDVTNGEPRSYAYITFGGTEAEAQDSVAKAMIKPVTCKTEDGDTVELIVEFAEKSKVHSTGATNIWEQMSRVKAARESVNLVPHSAVIVSENVEEAKMLLYEICFTAVTARYKEMEHHQLIGLKSLDRLQEAIKKGQDILVQLRDKSLADVQREKLPNPMYLAWNDDRTDDQGAFKLSVMSMVLGGDKVIRPESLTSVKNFVKAKNHKRELSMSRFKHIEELMLCAEMAWAVREAHHEIIYHVLHGETVDTKDDVVLKARAQVSQEMRMIVSESEKVLEGMHKEHWHMMQLVHTVIASRATLHIIQNKISILVHKGFFDENDEECLNHVIDERLLQMEKSFNHGIVELAYHEARRTCCHRKPAASAGATAPLQTHTSSVDPGRPRGLAGLHMRRMSASEGGAPPSSPAQMNTVEEAEEKEAFSPELNLEPEPEPEPEPLMPRP